MVIISHFIHQLYDLIIAWQFNLLFLCFLGFREKDHIPPLNASGGHKISNESLTRTESGIHNRTYSDGGSSIGSNTNNNYPPPPSGPRVVLGRETTPTMSGGGSSQNITNARQGETAPTKIPKEVWDRFEGKSREVRIKSQFDGIYNDYC